MLVSDSGNFTWHWEPVRSAIVNNGDIKGLFEDRTDAEIAETFAFVRAHHLREVWHCALSQQDASSAMPKSDVQRLDRYMADRRQRSADLVELLCSLKGSLDDAGIDCLLLKGPYYRDRYYPRLMSRQFDDLDILVRKEDLERSVAIFDALGFAQPDRRPMLEGIVRRFEHAILLQREKNKLDLHWTIRNRPGLKIGIDRLRRNARTFEIADQTFRVPDDEYVLLSIALEIAEGLERGGVKLKRFFDLHRFLEVAGNSLSWTSFFAARRTDNSLRLIVNVLAIHFRVFGTDPPCTALATAIAEHEDLIIDESVAGAIDLVSAPRGGPAGRIWFARCLEHNPISYFAWHGLAFIFARTAPKRAPRASTTKAILSYVLGVRPKRTPTPGRGTFG